MKADKKTLVLYYKSLIIPGGAERLLLREYFYFQQKGYEVILIVNQFRQEAFFGTDINQIKLIVLGKSGFLSFFKLVLALKRLDNPTVLCSSGHLDIYLASLFTNFNYSLHIHHPCFMSFNDYDKYSLLLASKFDQYCQSNYGAQQFIKIRSDLNLLQKIKLNVRALVSWASIKKSRCNFVLSNYAKNEKKDLYGVDAIVAYGALEDNFQVMPAKVPEANNIHLLTVARLDINKRIDTLIEAVKILQQQGWHVQLCIIGDGPERENLQRLIENLDMVNCVHLLGFVDDDNIDSYFSAADLFVSIDWADYKLTLFEALAKGTAVLVSNETECDKDLLAAEYISITKPEPTAVATAIAQWHKQHKKIDNNLLQSLLQPFTWGRYFARLESHLHLAHKKLKLQ